MIQADSVHSTPPTNTSSSDEIIEKFASLYADIEAYRPEFEKIEKFREQEIARRSGIPSHWSFRSEAEVDRHLVVMRVVDEEIGFNAANERMEKLECRLDPLVRTIVNTPARDLIGLALKANAVARSMPALWGSIPDELDYPEELIRNLIEEVCAIAGVDIFVNRNLKPRADLN
jgi:hypothetical protein